MKKILLLLIVLSVNLLYSVEIKTVIASGYGDDIEKAKANALRNAVEQVLGVYVASESYVQNFMSIKDNIYSQTEGYIDSYKIIQKEIDKYGGKTITIEARVIKTNLEEDLKELGLLSKQLDMPRVLVASYRGSDNNIEDAVLEKVYGGIVQVLTAHGFFVLDKSTLEDFYKQQKDIAYAELNSRISDYGLKVNADYIIKFDFRMSDDGVGYCDAEVISTSTGKVLLSVDEVGELEKKKDTDLLTKILFARNVGKSVGKQLYEKIRDNWSVRVEKGKYFTLVVEGYTGYQEMISLQDKLLGLKGVVEVSEIESGDNKTTMLVVHQMRRNDLKENFYSVFKQMQWSTRLVRSENNRMFIKVLK